LSLYGKTEQIAKGKFKRLPVRDYLLRQGRFAHFADEDIAYFQNQVDEMWERWLVPGVIPLQKECEYTENAPGKTGGFHFLRRFETTTVLHISGELLRSRRGYRNQALALQVPGCVPVTLTEQ